jgi:hypothetical protein
MTGHCDKKNSPEKNLYEEKEKWNYERQALNFH